MRCTFNVWEGHTVFSLIFRQSKFRSKSAIRDTKVGYRDVMNTWGNMTTIRIRDEKLGNQKLNTTKFGYVIFHCIL